MAVESLKGNQNAAGKHTTYKDRQNPYEAMDIWEVGQDIPLLEEKVKSGKNVSVKMVAWLKMLKGSETLIKTIIPYVMPQQKIDLALSLNPEDREALATTLKLLRE